MSGKPVFDFDVVREPWNKYELADGCSLKLKVVLTKLRKKQVDEKNTNYDFDVQNLAVVLTDEKGPPDTKTYSPQELTAAIIKDDIRYTTTSEEWNEYVADDGARVRLKVTVTRVAKTSKFDKNGEPIYLVESGALAQIKRPTP